MNSNVHLVSCLGMDAGCVSSHHRVGAEGDVPPPARSAETSVMHPQNSLECFCSDKRGNYESIKKIDIT